MKKSEGTQIADNYTISKDRYQWILTEHYEAADKDGAPKTLTRDSYHSNLNQVSTYLINNNVHHSLARWIADAGIIAAEMTKHLSAALENNNG